MKNLTALMTGPITKKTLKTRISMNGFIPKCHEENANFALLLFTQKQCFTDMETLETLQGVPAQYQ